MGKVRHCRLYLLANIWSLVWGRELSRFAVVAQGGRSSDTWGRSLRPMVTFNRFNEVTAVFLLNNPRYHQTSHSDEPYHIMITCLFWMSSISSSIVNDCSWLTMPVSSDRSPGTGLYDSLHQYNLPYPEALFDIRYFTKDPRPFCRWLQSLSEMQYRPNPGHYFVRLLQDKGLLLRSYTQNIDGLERSMFVCGYIWLCICLYVRMCVFCSYIYVHM